MDIPGAVARNIYFYAVDIGVDDSGRLLPFDPTPPLRHIHSMPFRGPDRRLQLPNDRASYCWVDSDSAPHRLRLANIRRSGFPFVELEGSLTPLEIREGSGLADPIHVVFFENNIVGADYNFYGPRTSGLQNYLAVKAPKWCQNLKFGTLVDPDTAQRLDRYEELRVLELRMRPADAEILRNYSRGLAGSFDAANEFLDKDARLELVLKPRSHSRGGIGREILQTVKRMFVNEELRDRASRFRVQGINQQGDTEDPIDLLSDDLVVRKPMIRQDSRSRAVVAESAYEAISEAHAEVQHKLTRASRLYVLRSGDGRASGSIISTQRFWIICKGWRCESFLVGGNDVSYFLRVCLCLSWGQLAWFTVTALAAII